jgi:hypothetical protein
MTAILAEMQAMQAEMNAMHQAGAGAAVGAAPIGGDAPIGANDEGGGVAQPRGAPQQYLDLRGWCGMSLEQFAGTGAPIEAVDWLSAATEKLDAFRISHSEWVRYATQLLKGEALVWWRNVQHLTLLYMVLYLGLSLSINLRGDSIQLLSQIRWKLSLRGVIKARKQWLNMRLSLIKLSALFLM